MEDPSILIIIFIFKFRELLSVAEFRQIAFAFIVITFRRYHQLITIYNFLLKLKEFEYTPNIISKFNDTSPDHK